MDTSSKLNKYKISFNQEGVKNTTLKKKGGGKQQKTIISSSSFLLFFLTSGGHLRTEKTGLVTKVKKPR